MIHFVKSLLIKIWQNFTKFLITHQKFFLKTSIVYGSSLSLDYSLMTATYCTYICDQVCENQPCEHKKISDFSVFAVS